MRLFAQMALVALVIGTSTAAAATERVTLSLVLTSAIGWAFVPLLQLGTGLWLTRSAPAGRRVFALERYFATHPAWSVWILAVHAMFLLWPVTHGFTLLLLPMTLLPIVLTVRALKTMCRDVLGLSPAEARRAIAIHQGTTWLMVAAYATWASAYLPRVVGVLP